MREALTGWLEQPVSQAAAPQAAPPADEELVQKLRQRVHARTSNRGKLLAYSARMVRLQKLKRELRTPSCAGSEPRYECVLVVCERVIGVVVAGDV